uniref:Unkown protein n=1 Tax=Riptortus pedestris TaxID=329032 RepID=R4WSE7_RIPPE|nr:unkown protein [Riptortus pedestris]
MDSENVVMNQKMEGWPECFQDVSSYCHRVQDELNTPQNIMNDEFNFSLDGQVNNCNNQWGYEQSPGEFSDPWGNQDLILTSPNLMVIDEENNNFSLLQSNYLNYPKMDISESGGKVDVSGASSSNVLTTKGNVLLSQATLLREDSPSTGEAQVAFTADYSKLNSSQFIRLGSGGKLLKSEKVEEPRVPAVENHLPPVLQQHQEIQSIPAISKRTVLSKSKPRLKLEIPQAPEPQSNTTTLTTPEVLSSFIDKDEPFDLLAFVCSGSDFSTKTQNVTKIEGVASFQDHDYTDSKGTSNENVYIKSEPMSPSGAPSRMSLNDDDDFDSDPSVDSESEEWSPSGKQPRRQSLSGRPKKRVRKPSSIDSSDGQDKYRALRDRNNEASRRSRLNRKQKDMEMKRYRSELEKRNLELKVKSDRMEALVKEMRAAVLRFVRNKSNR